MRRAIAVIAFAATMAGCAHSPTVAGAVDAAQATMPVAETAVDAALSGCPPELTERCAELDSRLGVALANIRDALLELDGLAAELDALVAEWSPTNGD